MIPKPKIVLGVVLWVIALSLGLFDVIGPVLGSAPVGITSSSASSDGTAISSTGTGSEQAANNGDAGSGSGENSDATTSTTTVTAQSQGGPAYQITKNIPEGVHQVYQTYHWFYFPLPLLYVIRLWWWCRKVKKQDQARKREIAQSQRTIPTNPYTKDQTEWVNTTPFGSNLFNALSAWPQSEPANRPRYGIFMTVGLAGHVGEGIRYYATVPMPSPVSETDPAGAAITADPLEGAGKNSGEKPDKASGPVWRGLEEDPIELEDEDEDEDEADLDADAGGSDEAGDGDEEGYSFSEPPPGTNQLLTQDYWEQEAAPTRVGVGGLEKREPDSEQDYDEDDLTGNDLSSELDDDDDDTDYEDD